MLTGGSASGSSLEGGEAGKQDDMSGRVLLDTESTDAIENQPWFYTDSSR